MPMTNIPISLWIAAVSWRLTALAGTAAAAAAIAPMLAANSAKAEMIAETDERIKGEDITYPGADGEMKDISSDPPMPRASFPPSSSFTRIVA